MPCAKQAMALPPLNAQIARNGAERRMVFTMPAGGRVVYLDRAGINYLVLPDKKQYAILDKDSLGFSVRQLMMPDQIVQRVKGIQGVKQVGEEKYEGRDAVRYEYEAVRDTQSKAGDVTTESFIIVDKETGLPLHAETVIQSQSGNTVQGFNGMRVVTDIKDIQTTAPADLFAEPTEFQKIESSQIKAQVDAIFSTLAAALMQVMNQARTAAPPPPAASPAR